MRHRKRSGTKLSREGNLGLTQKNGCECVQPIELNQVSEMDVVAKFVLHV